VSGNSAIKVCSPDDDRTKRSIWKGKTGLSPHTLLSSVPLRTRLRKLLIHALPVQVLQSKLRHDAGELELLPECNGAIMYEYDCRVKRGKTNDD
jgi:hypothetical protein